MKKIIKLLSITVVALLCVVFPSQAQGKHDELQTVITSDKEEYVKGESAEITIAVTNQSKQTISNVEVECLLPEGLRLADKDSSTASIKNLEAEKTLTMVVHVEATQVLQILPSPQTGDGAGFWSVSLVFIAAIIISLLCLWLRKEKGISSQSLFSVFILAVLMTGVGILSHKTIVKANAGEMVSFQESKQIRVEQEKYDVKFQITYEKPKATPPSSEALELVDFVVEVEDGREPVVLQLSDTQIIDASQKRYPARLDAVGDEYWGADKTEERCYSYLRETIQNTNPDLILITGDVVYGEFDDNGTVLQTFIEFMESFEIPWAPVFGNHDNESIKGVDWQCKQFENAQWCMFKQRKLTGNGNYTVGIKQGGELKRVFFMLDSNGCGAASSQSLANGHTVTSIGFGADQIEWYTETVQNIMAKSPKTKFTFAFHIQLAVFADAYAKYGFDNSTTKANPNNIYKHPDKAEGDFGYLGDTLKTPWDMNYAVWNGLKALGVDSILVGHEHCNVASVVYQGVRFQFGQKSSTYDRANFLDSDGTIVGGYGLYLGDMTPIMGGVVMSLSAENGTIKDSYVYLCNGLDWENLGKEEVEDTSSVDGLQYNGTDLYSNSNISVTTANIGGTNAYKCKAVAQDKLYVNQELLKNKSTFTFSVYVPEETTIYSGWPSGEFVIRVKPTEPTTADGSSNGYIVFTSDTTSDSAIYLTKGQWQTFTIDISELGTSCTEWAFVLFAGNTYYFKDIAIR